jgi:uncharacterized protein
MAPAVDHRVESIRSAIARHPVRVLVLAGVFGALCAGLATRLKLKTSIAELLPSNDPGVVALERTQKRIGDLSLLLIGIRSPDKDANLRYAEALTAKLRALPPSIVQLAAYNVRDLRDFYQRNKWLFVSEDDLEAIRDRVRNEIQRRKNPLFVSLDEDEPIDQMRARIDRKGPLEDRFPGGVFSGNNGEYVWIAALPPGGLFVEHAGEALYNAAERLVAEDPPTRYQPEMKVDIGGPISTAIAVRAAIEHDLVWVTVICLSIVALSIGLYFRRVRAIPLTGIPAAIGTLAAFAVADLKFGYLNSSTAFLGSIILGNGINYAIVLMSRYEEERVRVGDPAKALRAAIHGTWRGTAVASISASAAYASLMVTSFRGFYQFGLMGAVGAISCWISTFTVLPALLLLIDCRGGARLGPAAKAPFELGPLARMIGRRGGTVAMGFSALAVVAAVGVRHFLKDPFEYDFRKLDQKVSTNEDIQSFNRSIDQLFGRWPSPTIVLADSTDEVQPIIDSIRRQDSALPGPNVIGQIATIYDLLPGQPDVQKRKLALLAEIRKLTHDPALSALDEKDRADLAKIDPPANLRQLGPMDVPAFARRPFTEADGTVGRVVLVYPPEQGLSVWNGRDLLRIAAVLQRLHLPNGKVIETSGQAVVFGAMIQSILHDGPIATIASLLSVILIVGFAIRPPWAALTALGTLLLGVLTMVGIAGWARVHVTFLNFIALPITFGIGAEYALNVIARYREEGNAPRAVISTGAAVALCSWTTIVGYGSLLAARNQALRGFGIMAILGEVSCLAAAIVALPAVLAWRESRRASPSHSSAAPPPIEPPGPQQASVSS